MRKNASNGDEVKLGSSYTLSLSAKMSIARIFSSFLLLTLEKIVMKITVPILAAAVSLAVFACSESPSSPSDESSSSGIPSSSSGGGGSSSSLINAAGRACEYSGEDFGVSGLFVCEEAPSDMPNLQKYKTECEADGGTWVSACPSGEKAICIDEEDEYEGLLSKLYADGFVCGDFMLKNADGSEDDVAKGGACGPYFPYGEIIPLSMCAEFPELSTVIVKLSCAELDVPFASKCPGSADLTCYDPEEDMISHFYGSAVHSLTCEDWDMEEL